METKHQTEMQEKELKLQEERNSVSTNNWRGNLFWQFLVPMTVCVCVCVCVCACVCVVTSWKSWATLRETCVTPPPWPCHVMEKLSHPEKENLCDPPPSQCHGIIEPPWDRNLCDTPRTPHTGCNSTRDTVPGAFSFLPGRRQTQSRKTWPQRESDMQRRPHTLGVFSILWTLQTSITKQELDAKAKSAADSEVKIKSLKSELTAKNKEIKELEKGVHVFLTGCMRLPFRGRKLFAHPWTQLSTGAPFVFFAVTIGTVKLSENTAGRFFQFLTDRYCRFATWKTKSLSRRKRLWTWRTTTKSCRQNSAAAKTFRWSWSKNLRQSPRSCKRRKMNCRKHEKRCAWWLFLVIRDISCNKARLFFFSPSRGDKFHRLLYACVSRILVHVCSDFRCQNRTNTATKP